MPAVPAAVAWAMRLPSAAQCRAAAAIIAVVEGAAVLMLSYRPLGRREKELVTAMSAALLGASPRALVEGLQPIERLLEWDRLNVAKQLDASH